MGATLGYQGNYSCKGLRHVEFIALPKRRQGPPLHCDRQLPTFNRRAPRILYLLQ